ncbi:DUF2207 family protein [Streptomyces sp. NPDC101132]|uniref:DUF2207 family protein n=1 Tax=Streptomyces sp. NPDC101132 TaxID=3366110 RepID=UPI0038284484
MTWTQQLVWAASAALALWLVGFALALVATRNGAPHTGPATQEFGEDPEPPAVVSLLANHWRSVDHAAEATLLDLAHRGLVELRQNGDRAAHTTVHVPGPGATGAAGSAEELRPYERRVLARVAERAGTDGAPLGAVTFRGRERAAAWNRGLRQEVVAEARRLGLSRPRFGPGLNAVLMAGTLVPTALYAVAVLSTGRLLPAVTVASLVIGPLTWLVAKATGERATEAGLDRAGHWAGVRAWLHAHEEFAKLPPAAVAVWDRYLSYGAALGVTTRINQLLDFGTGSRRRVWSAYGGTWREVRIRYPRLLPGFGAGPARLLRLAAAAATVAVGLLLFATLREPAWAVTTGPDAEHSLRRPGLLLSAGWVLIAVLAVLVAGRFRKWTPLAAFLALMPGNFASLRGWGADAFDRPGLLPGEAAVVAVFGALTAWYVVQLVLGRIGPRTLTGEVLRVETRRDGRAPLLLALDEGTADRTVAWALDGPAPTHYSTGSEVRLTVERGTRRVRTVQVLDVGSEHRLEPAGA